MVHYDASEEEMEEENVLIPSNYIISHLAPTSEQSDNISEHVMIPSNYPIFHLASLHTSSTHYVEEMNPSEYVIPSDNYTIFGSAPYVEPSAPLMPLMKQLLPPSSSSSSSAAHYNEKMEEENIDLEYFRTPSTLFVQPSTMIQSNEITKSSIKNNLLF